jgi:hypothetical protein
MQRVDGRVTSVERSGISAGFTQQMIPETGVCRNSLRRNAASAGRWIVPAF